MVRRNPKREARLAEVKHAHRLAGQKVSKLERQGIRVRKEGLDPRVPAHELSQMNSRQLAAYQKQLDAFRSRTNGYVAGKGGQPIQRSTWNAIKRAEAQYNTLAKQYEAEYGNINVPGTGMDVAGRLEMLRRLNKYSGKGQSKTFEERNRTSQGLNGQEAAEEILKNLRNMTGPGYLNKRMRAQRANLETMLTTSGDQDALEKIRKLTNNQLNIAIDYSPLMSLVGGKYTFQKSLNAVDQLRPEDEWMYSENRDNAERILSLVDWASTLPKNSGATRGNTRSTKEYTDTNARLIPTQFDPRNTNAGPIPIQRSKRKRK